MPTVTPRGSRRIMLVNPRSYSPADLPSRMRAAPAKKRRLSTMNGMSAADTEIGLPTSIDSSLVSSSASASSASASFSIMAERSFGGVSNHTSSYAFCAAATARSASSGVATGISAMTSPVAGLMSGAVSPEEESTHSPPTNICPFFTVVAMALPSSIPTALPTPSPTLSLSPRPSRAARRKGPIPLVRLGQRIGPPIHPVPGRQQVARPQRQEQLHAVARRREVAAGQLLHLAHAVPERVTVHEQLRRSSLPPCVALQERLQRRNQVAAVPLVVLVERAQDARGEGGERHGILQR